MSLERAGWRLDPLKRYAGEGRFEQSGLSRRRDTIEDAREDQTNLLFAVRSRTFLIGFAFTGKRCRDGPLIDGPI
jgi:hypothetical protein